MSRWTPEALGWRNRIASGAAVGAYLLASALLTHDASARAELHYAVVVTFGYGHLVGAALFSAERLRRLARGRRRRHFAVLAAGLALLLLLSLRLATVPDLAWLVLPLLAVSIWHSVENDVALPRFYGAGAPPRGWRRSLDRRLATVGATALVTALAGALLESGADAPLLGPATGTLAAGLAASTLACRTLATACGIAILLRGRPETSPWPALVIVLLAAWLPDHVGELAWLRFADVFAAASLHHLVSWLLLSLGRVGRSRRRAADGVTLTFVHAVPLACCVALLTAGTPDSQAASDLRAAFFSPLVYLFWSTLHVVQTLAVRALATHPAPPGRDR